MGLTYPKLDLAQYDNLPIQNEVAIYNAIVKIDAGIAWLKEKKAEYENEMIIFMQENKIAKFEIDGKLVFVSKKTTDRYYSEELKKAIRSDNPKIASVAMAALPLNPAWRKTEVMRLQEMLCKELHTQDIEDKLEIKKIPLDRLKKLSEPKHGFQREIEENQ